MADLCRRCGRSSFYLQQHGMQVGMYCSYCGTWMKWVSKKEQAVYRNRGMEIYSQDVKVKLKIPELELPSQPINKNQSLGLESISEEVGFEETSAKGASSNVSTELNEKNSGLTMANFGNNPDVLNLFIETEVTRRLQEKLKEKAIEDASLREDKEEKRVGSEYCPICDGSPLVAESGSKVEVSIFSGVMTITDLEGIEILGLYRLKRCPNCGKIF